jgi:hypothetical protein
VCPEGGKGLAQDVGEVHGKPLCFLCVTLCPLRFQNSNHSEHRVPEGTLIRLLQNYLVVFL